MAKSATPESVLTFKAMYDELASSYSRPTTTQQRATLFNECLDYYRKHRKTISRFYKYDDQRRGRYTSRFIAVKAVIVVDVLPEEEMAPAYEISTGKEIPDIAGLYLLGDIKFDPALKIPTYWIKPGLSSQMLNRMRSYDTHNPVVYHLDFIKIEDDYERRCAEIKCHNRMHKFALNRCATNEEWFRVSETVYNEIQSKGFNFFFTSVNGQFVF